ncbi:MAG: type II toxin-antitoxin system HipA family toxin [Lachnospiraceae bacterium]|nr:type II toxin-antitoxin system HipA family toxin [Lachnospiraceae bacterium]
MDRYRKLNVLMGNRKVGTLAETPDHLAAFEYDGEWLADGFSISPLSLPLEKKVFIPKEYATFEGLFGVFADSLPDGWGRLLVDRQLAKEHIRPESVNALTRLAIVGEMGMGALAYQPEEHLETEGAQLSLDQIALECKKILESQQVEHLDTVFRMGASSGGARPKVFCEMDGEQWIVKFPSSMDGPDIGEQEYRYSLCAKKCGIDMPETRLIPSKINSGYFAVKRFDREGDRRVHMVSAGGLLETSHRIPNLDYMILMRLTMKLTEDYGEIEKLYRRMAFNVYSHNRDDHSKNFSYLCDAGKWCLSPAYDLTYSSSIGGEHATTINGNGRDPGLEDLLAVADNIKLDKRKAKRIAGEVREIVREELGSYLRK